MSADALWLRQAVVIASAVLYWSGVTINAFRIRTRLHRSPNVSPRGLKERLLWAGWFFVILGWIGQPLLVGSHSSGVLFSIIGPLYHAEGLLAGIALILSGQAGTFWCYAALGDSWRMGVDRREKTPLVRHGPYRLVRHPIYLFQVVILAGMICLLPTPFSFVVIAVHLICVLVKAFDEETHLMTTHGAEYREYFSQTGRLLPKLKSLRLLFQKCC